MISLILQGYGQCIETFITESQLGAYLRPDPFDDVLPLCTRSSEVIAEVFSNPDTVMAKLVQNIFHGKLQVDSGYSHHIPFYELCSSSDSATPSNPPFHCILPEGTYQMSNLSYKTVSLFMHRSFVQLLMLIAYLLPLIKNNEIKAMFACTFILICFLVRVTLLPDWII